MSAYFETVALDVETVARVIFAESEPGLYHQEDRGTALWATVMGQCREVAAAVVAADPRRTVAEVKAEAWAEGEWAGRQNAAEVRRYAHWSHIGTGTPNLLANPYAEADRIERDAATSEGVEG